jgi:hypothetical protein
MIPERIIQTGPKNLSICSRAGMANARLLHPNFEYLFFDDDAVERFLREEFPQYLEAFHSFPFRIQRYDFFRYLAVYRYGGFYFDVDVLLAEPLTPLVVNGCVFCFEELTDSDYFWESFRMDWQIGNYAFGAEAGHPFLKAIIDNCLIAKQDPTWVAPMMKWIPKPFRNEFYILNTTGPGLVSRTYAENPEIAADVEILFPEDVRDSRQWHYFGRFGIHNMDGGWRNRENLMTRRLRRMWEGWKMRRTLTMGRTRGGDRKGRQLHNGRASTGNHASLIR